MGDIRETKETILRLHLDGERVYIEIDDFFSLIDTIETTKQSIKALEKKLEDAEAYKELYLKLVKCLQDLV